MNFLKQHYFTFLAIIVVVIFLSMMFSNQTPSDSGDQNQLPFELFLDNSKTYDVTLTTDLGDITIQLFQNETPVAANNFAFLTEQGFYDGLAFHRVVKDFMIQGGDPNGDGSGGPGYSFNDEEITRDYTRGMVAYANSGENTNGSQFFIMQADYPLPKDYVIFGQVTSGMDVVDQIANAEVTANKYGEESQPVTPVTITKAALVEE